MEGDADADGDDDFLSWSATFEGLGLHPDVIAALRNIGLERPSQVMRAPAYLSAGCGGVSFRWAGTSTSIWCRLAGHMTQRSLAQDEPAADEVLSTASVAESIVLHSAHLACKCSMF